MNENVSVPVLDNSNSTGNLCANSSDIFQPNTPTSFWDSENYLYIGYLSISFLLGIPGNTLVLIILTSSKPRNNTDWYIIFISIFAITSLFSEVPLSIIMRTSLWSTIGFPNICRVKMLFSYISHSAQILLFSGLSIERYRCVSLSINVRTKVQKRRGLVVSLMLTSFVILLAIPTLVFKWDIANNACVVAPGQEIERIIFFGVLAAMFFILFSTSIISYVLVLLSLYKSQRRLSMIQKATPRPRMFNIRPTKMGKIGIAVIEVSSTLNEKTNKTSTPMNVQMFMPSNIRDKHTSFPLHTVEACALKPSKTSRGIRQIYPEEKRNVNSGKQSSSKTSNRLDKPNSTGRNGMKRTTFIIFLTTLIFIISWLPAITLTFIWSLIQREQLTSRNMAYAVLFMRRSHFINCFANPILYLTMHREGRQRTKILLCGSR